MVIEMERIEVKDLVLENKNLIYSIARKFQGDIEDLFQVGCIGLLKAYDNYKEDVGVKFTTYAYKYILGEIYQYVLRNKNIKLTPEMVKLNSAILEADEFLTQKFKRKPSYSEIADFLEIPIYKLSEVLNTMEVLSLDDERNDNCLYDCVGKEDVNNIDLIMLKDAISKLDTDERDLILKRYFYNMTQSEIAKENGVNQVKVSREEGKVLSKLRSYM